MRKIILALALLFTTAAWADEQDRCDDACFFHEHTRIWSPDIDDTFVCWCNDGTTFRQAREREYYYVIPYYIPHYYYYPHYERWHDHEHRYRR